ncbi:RES family NAD+ phosphorylase [Granulicella tundricola]|uniref:RES domain protein n=1 Tax=Granulicella tundricola (strain ATCC BAA-1859 / DSM 23138 / MP5ACTX9) TaxID=1198114 RepID=E8X3E6_GRATM|nr:RES family NAD+ phosphorylase [Granulicella tundricola]ADW70447.1 RES domain protein [Granulicella tundricola MP5ACTX9]
MLFWRISNYATLDGAGGLYVSGRWHTRGRPVVYCTWHPSTALLETLVHLEIDAEDRPANFQLLRIESPKGLSLERLEESGLPANWRADPTATQRQGDAWLASRRTLLLEVPSALLPETWNLIVNPLHPQAPELRITKIYNRPFDPRLI